MNNPSPVNSSEPIGARNVTIGIDARTFQYADSTSRGIGHYALHHLLATIPLCPEWRFILFNDSGNANAAIERLLNLPNVSLHSLDALPHPRVDLFHAPDPMNMTVGFDSPLRFFRNVPGTVIFHDLIPLRFYWNNWDQATQQAYLLRLDQLKSRPIQVLANSEFTRLDLIKGTGIPCERTHTIMAGLNRSEPNADVDPALFQKVRKEYGINKKFFLHVGALDPHKNFETVIHAFGRVPAGAVQLVVVGQKEHYLRAIAAFVEKQKMKDIIFTGFIPRSHLEALYQEAAALLFLSKYEGFGFPVLEAMANGCPVITTNVTSIPEVAGNAAMMFDPADVAGIGAGMQQLLGSFTKRDEFRRKGFVQAEKFTWETTALKTIAVWEQMLGAPVIEAKGATSISLSNNLLNEASVNTPAVAAAGLSDKAAVPEVASNSAVQPFTRGVVWFAPWQNPSGYCSEALAYAQGIAHSLPLELADVARTKSPSFVAGLPAHLQKMLRERLKEQIDPTAKIAILHMPGGNISYLPGSAYCIGRTMFETEQLPPAWVTQCNLMDEVWVPSRFNAATFAANGVEPSKLVVMPQAVDENEFDPARHQPLPLPDRAKFNFLSVFEWSARKGWDVLLSAYLREFSAADDVCLHLRAYLVGQPDGDPVATLERLIREHVATLNLGDKKLPRIKIIGQQIPQCDLPRLYKSVDCLVAPSRGEGWGRPQHEAMLMELPVIATNWSGNTEFMNADNAYLLDYEMIEANQLEAELWHYRGHRWANPSETHLSQLMRRVFENRDEATAKGKAARGHMVENFSIARVGEKVMSRLRAIESKLSVASCEPLNVKTQNSACPDMHAADSKATIQVAWDGSFLDLGSLSHVNRELTGELAKQPRVKVSCIGKNTLTPNVSVMPVVAAAARKLQTQAPRDTQVTVRHAWPPVWQQPASGAWVLIQPWEFGALPVDWVANLSHVDEAWVPSEYVRRVYIDSGVDSNKVKVVPNGIDPAKFRPDFAPMKLPTRKTFKFLFVGGTIHRKGPDLLLESYLRNFTATDDVCLVIKDFGGKGVYAGQTFEQKIKAAQAQPHAPEILHLTEDISSETIAGLYTACDCLVHPYRGEGFGLPVLEAMACGLPVVVTAGGSTDDFAPDDFAYRIPSMRKNIGGEVSGMKLIRDGWLLEPDAAALSAQMIWIFKNREAARAKGRAASEYVRREWTWERAAQIANQRIREIAMRKQAQTNSNNSSTRQIKSITLPDAAKIGHLAAACESLRKNDFQAAWKNACNAIASRPFHCEAWLLLAEVAQTAGDFDRARVCAETAKRLAPDWKPARQFIKAIANKTGKSVEWAVMPELAATPRLSVCLITKNEEQFLEQCLESVRGIAHQIVVVDTGSTDRTIEIAKKFNAEVHSFAWCDDFSAARNEALKHTTGDWVLSLDADEELLSEHRATLVQEMQAADVMAYRLPIIDKGREEDGCSYVPRLFRNASGLFFVGRVHEQIFSSVEIRAREWNLENKLGKAALLHHGYLKEVVASRNKGARNLRLLQLAIAELPGEPNLVMNLGLELVRSGQLEAGLEQYREALKLMAALPAKQVVPELRETLITQFATHLLKAKRFTEIAALWQQPFVQSAGVTASQHFLRGLAHLELKQPAEAAEQMRQCVAKRNQPALSPINKEILKAGPQHCLALALNALGDAAAADVAFCAALVDDPASRSARFDFAKFQAQQSQPVEALKMLTVLVQENAGDAAMWQFGARIALAQPDFLEFAQDWTSEAIKHFPGHHPILIERAEALLLNGDAEGALPLWLKAHSPGSGRHLAALTICEMVASECSRSFSPADEKVVAQEFLKWYRQFIRFGAKALVARLNENLDELRTHLPTATAILQTAVKKAEVAVAA